MASIVCVAHGDCFFLLSEVFIVLPGPDLGEAAWFLTRIPLLTWTLQLCSLLCTRRESSITPANIKLFLTLEDGWEAAVCCNFEFDEQVNH